MFGTILNVLAILAGGVIGLTVVKELSVANQMRLKLLLGVLTVLVGLSLTWTSISGSFLQVLGQLGIVMLSLVLGNATGKLLRLQAGLNRLGRYAKRRATETRPDDPNRTGEGFITCSILYCVGPMAVLGALQDGLTGNFKILAVKSAMDGLATMAFSKTFGWGVMLSVIPVLAYQGSISLGGRLLLPLLERKDLLDSLSATGGLLVFSVSLVVLEIKRVPLADYLPSLVYAPLLTWLWR